MLLNLITSWENLLKEEFKKDYFNNLISFVKNEYENNVCFPPQQLIFNCFNKCKFEDIKVVIIGQDPYHGIGQANGLCFSVNENISLPPSLVNIYKEIESDLNVSIPKTGNLDKWASQGVLLLNATLTVRENFAGSHQNKGWEKFTDEVINIISEKKENIVFLLWGGYAKKKGKNIDRAKHFILESGHPSPLSANRGFWFGNSHFSKTNEILIQLGHEPIKW